MGTIFESAYSHVLEEYINYRKNCGIKNIASECTVYKKLDRFIKNEGINDIIFTKEHAERWKAQIGEESSKTRYNRVNLTKHFFEYLFVKGYKVTQFRDIRFVKTNFAPHIYTEDEIARYFKAVDSFIPKRCQKNVVQLPVFFRLLYCCGTRVTETTLIRKCDVDLENGIIKLRSSTTKKNKERYAVMSSSLAALMKEYADKIFYALPEDGFIFTTYEGTPFRYESIRILHRRFLQMANIPYLGDGHGPRIHDFRHTFAVNSFKTMIDNGMDMYVCLPIMSAYLGHDSIAATEHYLRMTMSMYPYIEEKLGSSLDVAFSDF